MTKRMPCLALGLECLLLPVETPELCGIERFIFFAPSWQFATLNRSNISRGTRLISRASEVRSGARQNQSPYSIPFHISMPFLSTYLCPSFPYPPLHANSIPPASELRSRGESEVKPCIRKPPPTSTTE